MKTMHLKRHALLPDMINRTSKVFHAPSRGRVGPRTPTQSAVIEHVYSETTYTILCYRGGRWEYIYGEQVLMVEVPEWDDLTESVMTAIAGPFSPGCQLDREFVEPFWVNVTSSAQDWYEEANGAHDMDTQLTDHQKERLHRICINRVIGSIEMLLYGQVTEREYL
jgi:hypothetical protein